MAMLKIKVAMDMTALLIAMLTQRISARFWILYPLHKRHRMNRFFNFSWLH